MHALRLPATEDTCHSRAGSYRDEIAVSKSPPLTGVVIPGAWPLPNTTPTPEVGETVKAVDVQMAAQGLLNQDRTIEERGAFNTVAKPGGNPGTFGFIGGIVATLAQIQAAQIGAAEFNGIVPAPTADPGADNVVQAGNVILAHGKLDFNAGVYTIVDGYNVASVSVAILVQITVTFVRPMADANYTIVLGSRRGAGAFIEYPLLLTQTANDFTANIRDLAAAGAPINLTTQHPGELYFIVTGSQ